MNFSVIICTCNRHKKVMELIRQVDGLNKDNLELIVIDSSEEENPFIGEVTSIKYHRTQHKNQPFQRYIGFHLSSNEYLLYLDDDMEIVHDDLFEQLSVILAEKKPAGLALKYAEAHGTTSLAAIPKSEIFGKLAWLKRFKNSFSGIPDLGEGKLGLNGNRGKQPKKGGETQFVSGGSFLASREALYVNFNMQMFDLYEQKLGKGEDSVMGYSISKQGLLHHIPEVHFLHNDQQNSSYSSNLKNFGTRFMMSRLFLSLEISRLDNKSLFFARSAYHWFALWRIFGLFINYLKNRKTKRKSFLAGALKGWKLGWKFKFNKKLTRNEFWENEIRKELND